MLQTGASFAGYHLEGVLGQGGMGTVYLAKHPRLPRSVALKVLNREFSAAHELQRRFEREADVVAQLDHPGIVGIFDRGTDDGYLWIAMQFVRGTDAATWDASAYPADVTARLIGETASALDYANQHGVLHRDVKPGNILIADPEHGREIRAVLTDFGIARVTTANTQLTATGTFTATLAYASPEQLSGEVVDHRSDQYSLACTLFAMYAGHPPYTATNPGQVVAGHLSHPVPRLTAIRPDLPPAIDAVIARAMAKHRDERFSSSTEFASAVCHALDGGPVAAPHPVASSTRAANSSSEGLAQQPRADGAYYAQPVGHAEGYVQQPWHAPAHQGHAVGGHVPQSWPDPRFGPAVRARPQQGLPPGAVPSRVSATIAGIGAMVIGAVLLGFAVLAAVLTNQANRDGLDTEGNTLAIGLLGAGAAVALISGTLIMQGRTTGRVLTTILATPVVLYGVGATVAATVEGVYWGTAAGLLGALTGIGIVGCALSPSTGRWIRYRKALRANRW
ncbi:protein kinase domain-containing protein [Nocardia sp. JW2]|uniref:serine/threonine-protein kinase n=1 Tax=Nocardia sp. JW2 TaxID=3450738 RepID=UPI003F443255